MIARFSLCILVAGTLTQAASAQPCSAQAKGKVTGIGGVQQLRAAGIEVTVDPKVLPNGRFARLHDPEGNPIELWEPKDK
ncbi:MAG TPA: hypothetical protein VMN60_07410 [Longimicrobiales bacterium]|nr:hypothetical protein [Longimicrobiales bacterium]